MFEQIHFGQWFRYFTGVVESVAALLVLIPRAAILGLLLLACTMLCASLIVAFVLHQPGEAAFPGLLFLVLAVICWKRRSNKITTYLPLDRQSGNYPLHAHPTSQRLTTPPFP